MFHCSVAPLPGRLVPKEFLRETAIKHLRGVGEEKHQWEEWTGVAYHVRRRLTPKEQKLVGEVVDCRGTEEGWRRYRRIENSLSEIVKNFALEELS